MRARVLGEALGIADALAVWSDELDLSEPFAAANPIPRPTPALIEAVARRSRFRDDVTDTLIRNAGVWDDPEIRRVAQHAQWRSIERYDPDELFPAWPTLDDASDEGVRLLWAYVALSLAPRVRALHRERAIEGSVTDATLWDIGQQVWVHRELFGTWGMGETPWLLHHLNGRLFHLGRLQFQLRRWFLDDEPGGPRRGSPVLDVHIPEAGPLEPAACEESYALAREFFARHFAEHRAGYFSCVSWLLDPQLADHLDADTNIVRFQRRYRRVETKWPIRSSILRFVFHEPSIEADDGTVAADELDRLSPRTALERAIVAHLRGGGRWYLTPGWFGTRDPGSPDA